MGDLVGILAGLPLGQILFRLRRFLFWLGHIRLPHLVGRGWGTLLEQTFLQFAEQIRMSAWLGWVVADSHMERRSLGIIGCEVNGLVFGIPPKPDFGDYTFLPFHASSHRAPPTRASCPRASALLPCPESATP